MKIITIMVIVAIFGLLFYFVEPIKDPTLRPEKIIGNYKVYVESLK